ncbi:hypothetical protein PYCH_10610 [Pyrococcus yayanosii CH1]|uniref:Uncharacterized protein n=2 Tax=Pyrococcus TaxID=2260 RepID=F8AER0_PYRYC|nr:hypothetical protein PYCH_10610 [Pyrococcus yayanosii CH1]
MRKLAVILIGLAFFAILQPIEIVSAQESYSGLSKMIGLKLGGYIEFGRYTVKFTDVDQDWTKAVITIYEDGVKKAEEPLSVGDVLYYPSSANVLFAVKLSWVASYREMVYLELMTPLKLLKENYKMTVGATYTLPSGYPPYKITLTEVTDNTATFKITTPSGSIIVRSVDEGKHLIVAYPITSDISQTPIIYLILDDAVKDDYAIVDIYVPTLIFSGLKIVEGGNTSEKENAQVVEEPTQLIYSDILYVGERLRVDYNGTTYQIYLATLGYYSKFSILDKAGKVLETFTVKEGGSYTCTKAPLRVEIPPNSVDLEYNRTLVRVYAPPGAVAEPIIREAKVIAELSVSSRALLLDGEELIVFINVRNDGRGNAFRVKVVAPLPNDFELKSGIGVWTLSTLDPFSEMPVLVYTIKPTKVGTYSLGPVKVEYYNEAGKKISVTSNTIDKIVVYAIPRLELKAVAYNGTWSNYVRAKANSTIRLRFTVSAAGTDPTYEFVKNATLILKLGNALDGEETLYIGDLAAGEEKVVEGEYLVLGEGISIVGATLRYQDPLGNWHEQEFPNLVLINSVPPTVIVKEKVIEKWPTPEDLPEYIDSVLASMGNSSSTLAEEIMNVTAKYVPQEEKKDRIKILLSILLTVFLVTTVAFGTMMLKYKGEYEKLREKLRRKSRPGGLPKKEEQGYKEEGIEKV